MEVVCSCFGHGDRRVQAAFGEGHGKGAGWCRAAAARGQLSRSGAWLIR